MPLKGMPTNVCKKYCFEQIYLLPKQYILSSLRERFKGDLLERRMESHCLLVRSRGEANASPYITVKKMVD